MAKGRGLGKGLASLLPTAPSASSSAIPAHATIIAALPATARLSASVPPRTKRTSGGEVPRSSATWRRARSSASLAFRPSAWGEEGFPQAAARTSAMASAASGRRGVVAAWSR